MKESVLWAGIHILRAASRWLPVSVLRVCLLPMSLAYTLYELRFADLSRYANLFPPAHGRLKATFHLFRRRVALSTTRLIRFWPDQLSRAKWGTPVRPQDLRALNAILEEGTPVILVTLHYGCAREIGYTLRSSKVRVCGLVTPVPVSPRRARLDARADEVNDLVGLPYQFQAKDIWAVDDFLRQPGNVLALVLDAAMKGDSDAVFLNRPLRIATGVERLAAITGSVIVPCLFQTERAFKWKLWFGTPRRVDELPKAGERGRVCQELLHEMEPLVAAVPEHCGQNLILAMQPEVVEAGSGDGLSGNKCRARDDPFGLRGIRLLCRLLRLEAKFGEQLLKRRAFTDR